MVWMSAEEEAQMQVMSVGAQDMLDAAEAKHLRAQVGRRETRAGREVGEEVEGEVVVEVVRDVVGEAVVVTWALAKEPRRRTGMVRRRCMVDELWMLVLAVAMCNCRLGRV